jgi:hypothetical protein
LGLGIRTAAALLAALVLGFASIACGSKGSPAGPSPQVNQTQFTVRIDGAEWTTARAFVSSQAGNTVITASDAQASRLVGIMFSGSAKVGSHPIEYTEDLPVSVTYFEGGPNRPGWTSFSSAARGEVNLTTITERSVTGTLSVVLVPFSPAASGLKSIEGTFHIAR